MLVNIEKIREALNTVKKVVNTTGLVKVKVEEDRMIFFANNGEVKVEHEIPVKEGQPMEFVLDENSRRGLSYYQSGEAKITFSDNHMEIKVGRSTTKYDLPKKDVTVEVCDDEELSSFKLSVSDLASITSICYAAAKDDNTNNGNGVFKGVNFNCNEGTITALDGFRIASRDLESIKQEGGADFTVKASLLVSMLKDFKTSVNVSNKGRWVEFASDSLKISLAKIDGKFNFPKSYLDVESEKYLAINIGELSGIIHRMMMVSRDKNSKLLKFMFKDGTISLKNTSKEIKIEEVLTQSKAEFDDELEIGFNAEYVLDLLKSYNEFEVIPFGIISEKDPIRVNEDGLKSLVLPVVV